MPAWATAPIRRAMTIRALTKLGDGLGEAAMILL
jgi:hypothetical protein